MKCCPNIIYALCLLASSLEADTVFLKTGRTLEGLVEEQAADSVILLHEPGIRLILKPSQVERIERSSPDEQQALRDAWKIRQSAQPAVPALPPELVELSALLDQLDRARREAEAASTRLLTFDRNLPNLHRQVRDALKQAAGEAEELKKLEPPSELNQFQSRPAGYRAQVKAYNAKVLQVEALFAEHVRLKHAVQVAEEEQARCRSLVQAYLHQAAAGSADLKDRVYQACRSAEHRDAADHLFERLASHTAAVRRIDPPTQQVGQHFMVQARINHRAEGRFLVDTGASMVLLSADFASRAGVAAGDPMTVRLADGTAVTVRRALLDTVQLGHKEERNVEAAVAEQAPGEGLDGLLGLSFLGRFDFSIDPTSGRLELRTLAPH